MNDRDSERHSLRHELTGGGNRTRQELLVVGQYTRWCVANSVEPFPTSHDDGERMLLRYLAAHHGRWRFITITGYSSAVAREFTARGLPDPRGDRYTTYLRVARRDLSDRTRPTDSFTAEQIVTIADRLVNVEVPPEVVRLRGVIAASEALGTCPIDGAVQLLPASAFRIRETDVIVTGTDGARHLLDADRSPALHAALVAALTAAGDADFPLATPLAGMKPYVARRRERRSLVIAWGRSRYDFPATPDFSAVRQAWQSSSVSDREWWMLHVDPSVQRRRRDLALLLLGVSGGQRYATIQRLAIGRLQDSSDGYRYEIAPDEHKGSLLSIARGGTGHAIVRDCLHLADSGSDCPPHCPACAVKAHLEVRARCHGAGTSDPVFHGEDGQPLSISSVTEILKGLWDLVSDLAVSDGSTPRISSRSLRVTAVTLARQQGLSLEWIRENITDHATLEQVQAYVRRADPFATDLTLDIADDT